jgi:hypothetical protein
VIDLDGLARGLQCEREFRRAEQVERETSGKHELAGIVARDDEREPYLPERSRRKFIQVLECRTILKLSMRRHVDRAQREVCRKG